MVFFSKLFSFNKEDNKSNIKSENNTNSIEDDKFELLTKLNGFPKNFRDLISSKNGLYFAVYNQEHNVKQEIILYKCNLQLKKCEIIFKDELPFKDTFGCELHCGFDLNNNYLVYYIDKEIKILDICKMSTSSTKMNLEVNGLKLANTKNIVAIHSINVVYKDDYDALIENYIEFYTLEETRLTKTLIETKRSNYFKMFFSYNDDYFIYNERITSVYKMDTLECIYSLYGNFKIILSNNSDTMVLIYEIRKKNGKYSHTDKYLQNLENNNYVKLDDKYLKIIDNKYLKIDEEYFKDRLRYISNPFDYYNGGITKNDNNQKDEYFEEIWTERDLNEYYTGDPDNFDWD